MSGRTKTETEAVISVRVLARLGSFWSPMDIITFCGTSSSLIPLTEHGRDLVVDNAH